MTLLKVVLQFYDQFFQVRVVGGRKAQQAYCIETGCFVILFCDLDYSVDTAESDGSSAKTSLAESASARTTPHDLNADAFVDSFCKGNYGFIRDG